MPNCQPAIAVKRKQHNWLDVGSLYFNTPRKYNNFHYQLKLKLKQAEKKNKNL